MHWEDVLKDVTSKLGAERDRPRSIGLSLGKLEVQGKRGWWGSSGEGGRRKHIKTCKILKGTAVQGKKTAEAKGLRPERTW